MTSRNPLILLAVLISAGLSGSALAAAPAPSKAAPARLDTNADGVIDRQEAAASPRLLQRFDALDRDKNGQLSAEEMPRWHARGGGHRGMGRGARGHGGQGFLRMMDSDGDGRVSAAEYQAFFERMDVNKDGYIDQADREARAKERREAWFRDADTDKDGKLSPAELEAARAKAGPRTGPGRR
ncbi:EF-hand domain-containing protein [Stenotrophomonas mori]|uniref:EF-hand domain-containing protein n=1 Tax=Stenotrophomonas mori TaxID=2871096 RepID=A0ABT0SH89_9GAMM|nr:EF-hand domain-containing protein [Stenotrophomonas mori]MCL7714349.1 EF-hand domain-containing protein [Stenotrophomonas mori]